MLAEQTAFSSRVLPRRWVARAFGWIPDVNAIPPRRLAAIGVTVSVIIHVLVLLFFIISNMVFPVRQDRLPPPPAPNLQVELVPMPTAPDAPLVPKRRPVIDANGLEKGEKPLNAEFETDRDMVAGSELPATGNVNMPSQEGRTDLPGLNFANQDLVLGVTPSEEPVSPDKSNPAEAPSPAQQAQAAAPPVKPLYKPLPVEKTEIAKAETAKPTDQLPEPAKPVRATPPPFKTSDRQDENTIAMLRSTPKPVVESEQPDATETRPRPAQPAVMPRKPASITDRFQENLRKTGVEGAINTKGKNGVNAINTPMGRYRRRMGQQIESLWNLKRQGHMGDLGGTVRIGVKISQSGRLERVQVEDDGDNPQHTEICLQAVREMRPEPMPPEAAPLLENGSLEITFSFTLY